MNTDELVSSLASLLGNIGTVLNDQIFAELKLAQVQMERGPLLPWFLVKEAGTSTVAGEGKLSLPSGFLREAEGGGFAILQDSKFLPLTKWDLDDLREEFEGLTGRPEYYALLGTQFWLYPVPSEVYSIQVHYYGAEPVLALGGEGNLWSQYYADLLIGLAGQNLCIHQRTLDIKPRFDEMVMLARQQLVIEHTAREMKNLELEFGG